jgi:restriction system protein
MSAEKSLEELLIEAQGGSERIEIYDVPWGGGFKMNSYEIDLRTGRRVRRIFLSNDLDDAAKSATLEDELRRLTSGDTGDRFITDPEELLRDLASRINIKPAITVSTVIIPDRKVTEGLLIKSTSLVWAAVVKKLGKDWDEAFNIPPEIWEEIVAGAYSRAGFDEVILTPRSGDHGRDVIAIRNGIGCIKVIGSVKAYKPGHLVKHDDVRALLGVMSGEQNTSKGILTTTSDFAPRIPTDPFIKNFLPTRLELMNGERLRDWLLTLSKTEN